MSTHRWGGERHFGAWLRILRSASLPFFLSFVMTVWSPPEAQAGFFDDLEKLGNTLGEGIDGIGKGVEDLGDGVEKLIGQEPAPPQQTTPPSQDEPAAAPTHNADRHKVARVQQMLNRLGYDAGTVDGLYGATTRKAIMAYETDRGLPRRGDVTDQFLVRLAAEEVPPPGNVAVTQPSSMPESAGTSPTARDTPQEADPSPATVNPGFASETDFAALAEPTYLELLRLYIAGNADLLDNDAFAYDYYALYGTDAEIGDVAWRRRCSDLRHTVEENEIRRQSVLADAHAFLRSRIDGFGAWPKTARFKIVVPKSLDDYDAAKGSFPLKPAYTWPESISAFFAKVDPVTCRPVFGTFEIAGITFNGVRVKPIGEDAIDRLPLPANEAAAYLDQHGRRVHIEMTVEVGPMRHGSPTPVRVVAARAITKDGALVFAYGAALFAQDAGAGDDATPEHPVAEGPRYEQAARSSFALLTLRDNPSLAAGEELVRATTRQISAEQDIWRDIDEWLKRAKSDPDHFTYYNVDPRRPTVLYEWQTLARSDPSLAKSVIENLFATTEPDWSFADAAEGLDPRFNYIKEAFVFSRGDIEGREPAFAAQQLAPVLRQHLLAAAQATSTHLYVERRLPGATYDMNRQAFVFKSNAPLDLFGSTYSRGVAFASSAPKDDGQSSSKVLPDAARTRALYSSENVMSGGGGYSQNRDKERRVRPSSDSADETWRQAIRWDPIFRGVLALDRKLRLEALSMDPKRAEALSREGHIGPYHGNLTARIRLDVERVELGERHSRQQGTRVLPVLFAKLAGVDILDKDGKLVVALPPDAFDRVAALLAKAEAAEDAKEQAAAARAAEEQRAAEETKKRFAALVQGRDGRLLIRRAESSVIKKVYTTGGSAGVGYSQTVRSNNLDLPPEGDGLTSRDMGPALRSESGAALVVDAKVFERYIFPQVMDLELVVTTFPPTQPAAMDARHAAALEALLPPSLNSARALTVRRRGDNSPLTGIYDATGGSFTSLFIGWEFDLAKLEASAPEVIERRLALRRVPDILKDAEGGAVILEPAGLRAIYPKLADLDLVVRQFPPEEYEFGYEKDHTETAADFDVLGISGGASEAEAVAAAREAFADGELAHDALQGLLRGTRGSCSEDALASPPAAEESGAYCLFVRVSEDRVTHVSLRQVVPGDAGEAVVKALAKRYGDTLYKGTLHLEGGGRRLLHGFGVRLHADRATLGRVDARTPPTALEAVVWIANGVTAVLMQLDTVPTVMEIKAAETPKIKF